MGTKKKGEGREENPLQVINSITDDNIVTSRGVISWSVISRGFLGGVTLWSRGLGSLVNRHLLVHFFEVQVLQVNSSGMLDMVPPQKLKTFKVPTRQSARRPQQT